ncbi:hypothetical protein MSMEI_0937 [Mycolicibacterium smegmatis MC2 155]|uniref:Uncharacterized protein n=2 Tax=Mycolicibacterium smegmatis TaxID=1772 RepID=I7FXD0_MYCS2|nr:hypothetical protein MSMEI_0937 [Mycolicibacterium smegmatis MC2 155]
MVLYAFGQPTSMTTDNSKRTEAPPITDAHREEAKRVMRAYDEDRPTTVLPGSGGTVAGTAVTDWVDDDGEPIFGEQGEKAE